MNTAQEKRLDLFVRNVKGDFSCPMDNCFTVQYAVVLLKAISPSAVRIHFEPRSAERQC